MVLEMQSAEVDEKVRGNCSNYSLYSIRFIFLVFLFSNRNLTLTFSLFYILRHKKSIAGYSSRSIHTHQLANNHILSSHSFLTVSIAVLTSELSMNVNHRSISFLARINVAFNSFPSKSLFPVL